MSKTEVIHGNITKNNEGGYTFSNFVMLSDDEETRNITEIIKDYIGGDSLWIKK